MLIDISAFGDTEKKGGTETLGTSMTQPELKNSRILYHWEEERENG